VDVWWLRCDALRWCAADCEDGACGPCGSARGVHAHATAYAWAWTPDDSSNAFHVINAITATYAVTDTCAHNDAHNATCDRDATNVDATNVDATNADATNANATNADATNADATNADATNARNDAKCAINDAKYAKDTDAAGI